MRYVLLVQYDGTHFCGYQRQREERTVQSVLEKAATEAFGTFTRVTASGRTDAGVHARGQVCQLDAETSVPAHKLSACLNCLLPPDCKVLKSAVAPEGFDCTRGAKKKTYRYTAYYAETELPLLARYAARLAVKPDLSRMEEAASLLEGEHDFAAFCSAGSSAKTSVRTVYGIQIGSEPLPEGQLYTISVTGNGFLYNMVRILAGEIFAVGCGKSTDAIVRALNGGGRTLLAKTMPARGLMLVSVDYGAELFPPEEV